MEEVNPEYEKAIKELDRLTEYLNKDKEYIKNHINEINEDTGSEYKIDDEELVAKLLDYAGGGPDKPLFPDYTEKLKLAFEKVSNSIHRKNALSAVSGGITSAAKDGWSNNKEEVSKPETKNESYIIVEQDDTTQLATSAAQPTVNPTQSVESSTSTNDNPNTPNRRQYNTGQQKKEKSELDEDSKHLLDDLIARNKFILYWSPVSDGISLDDTDGSDSDKQTLRDHVGEYIKSMVSSIFNAKKYDYEAFSGLVENLTDYINTNEEYESNYRFIFANGNLENRKYHFYDVDLFDVKKFTDLIKDFREKILDGNIELKNTEYSWEEIEKYRQLDTKAADNILKRYLLSGKNNVIDMLDKKIQKLKNELGIKSSQQTQPEDTQQA